MSPQNASAFLLPAPSTFLPAHTPPDVARPHRVAASRRRAPSMLESNTLLAFSVSVLGVGGGIGLLAFYEEQGRRTEQRENKQPCVECSGATAVTCSVCGGDGKNPLSRGKRMQPVSAKVEEDMGLGTAASAGAQLDDMCTYCEGAGQIRCFNCSGSGIQPRFLDRLSPDDFMD